MGNVLTVTQEEKDYKLEWRDVSLAGAVTCGQIPSVFVPVNRREASFRTIACLGTKAY